MDINTMGKVTQLPDDPEGTVNISNITIEFRDINENELSDRNEQPEEFLDKIEEHCIDYLNRLIEVIRYATRRYWIKHISKFHLNIFKTQFIGEDGEPNKTLFFFIKPTGGYKFPIITNTEESVKDKITTLLDSNDEIPADENLILDSLQFFSYGQFPESVIIANISLEVFVEKKIFEEMICQGYSSDDAKKISEKISSKGFEDGMKYFFFQRLKKKDGQFDEELLNRESIWKIIKYIRGQRRKIIHPLLGKINSQEAFLVLQYFFNLVEWLNSLCYLHIKRNN